jgi:hypothetical protein
MQLSPQELQMFESIARGQPRFKDWLTVQIGKQFERTPDQPMMALEV